LARLLELIFLLGPESGSGWTSARLAARFGISRRQVFLDLELLRRLGIRLANGGSGYRLLSRFPSLPVMLSAEEILALVRPEAGRREVREGAQRKLAQALPDPWRRLLSGTRRVRVLGGPSPVPERVWRAVEEGLAGRLLLRLRYRGHRDGGRPAERWVEPHTLFMKGTGWYVAAWCRRREGWRLFRLDRIEEAWCGGRFEERREFDVEEYLSSDVGVWVGRALDAEVEVLPTHVEAVGSEAAALGLPFRRRRGGGAVLEIPRANLDEAAWWLGRFGEGVRVVRPPELRARLAALGRRIVELNGPPEGG
jgi:predicted DNA-binding transcriptional regulator YafY